MNYIIIKIIAIITMLIDHMGYIVFDNNLIMRSIGRLSFPLFCFLLVNGFVHTRNKWRYFFRLSLFAIISEPFFNLITDPSSSNVFVTLSLGVLLMNIISSVNIKKEILKIPIELILVILFGIVSFLLNSDYSFFGITMIYFLYKTKTNKIYMGLTIILLNLFFGFAIYNNIQCLGAFSGLFVFFFEDKKVHINKFLKYFFYIFYPLHLFILYFFGGA